MVTRNRKIKSGYGRNKRHKRNNRVNDVAVKTLAIIIGQAVMQGQFGINNVCHVPVEIRSKDNRTNKTNELKKITTRETYKNIVGLTRHGVCINKKHTH